MRELLDLYLVFFRIGAFTFGGGLSMLPLLQMEIVDKKDWATEEELMDYYAIGQCTPGIIAVNTATFIGYKRRGLIGGIVATAGIVSPSVIIISIIASFLTNFSQIAAVQHAFSAIRVAVGVLILNTVLKMWKSTVKGKLAATIALLSFAVSVLFSPSPVMIVFVGAAAGVIVPAVRRGEK